VLVLLLQHYDGRLTKAARIWLAPTTQLGSSMELPTTKGALHPTTLAPTRHLSYSFLQLTARRATVTKVKVASAVYSA
jgi:hypothetical protein